LIDRVGIILGALKAFRTMLRNELRFKPLGRRAARVVVAALHDRRVTYRSIEVWLGLAEPHCLSCVVFVESDEAKMQFDEGGQLPRLNSLFREELVRVGYPPEAAAHVGVSVHSDEEIRRVGFRVYFA
jgi:hypothetical protein